MAEASGDFGASGNPMAIVQLAAATAAAAQAVQTAAKKRIVWSTRVDLHVRLLVTQHRHTRQLQQSLHSQALASTQGTCPVAQGDVPDVPPSSSHRNRLV